MANHKSAIKRNRQRDKRRESNRISLGSMRTAIKRARAAVESGEGEKASLITQAISMVDKAVSRGALKRETAARTISRLVRFGNKAN